MKIGTHNSMSYLPLKKWYMYPFNFVAKCQNLSIEEQYKKGARLFDIRIGFDSYDYPEFRHGLVTYKGDVYKVLEKLNSLSNNDIYVRLILEDRITDSSEVKVFNPMLFGDFCSYVKDKFSNIKFYEGRRKSDWKQLYIFPRRSLKVTQIVGSMTGKFIDSLCPYLYAKRNNKINLENLKDSKNWVLMDFIEIQ